VAKIGPIGICLALSLATAPVFAHHSLAMYDMTNPVTVKGVVERLEWTNPHVHLYVDVRNGKGAVEKWTIEMDRPDFLLQNGWTRTTGKARRYYCLHRRPSEVGREDDALRHGRTRQGRGASSLARAARGHLHVHCVTLHTNHA
jgi:hypothetical protein